MTTMPVNQGFYVTSGFGARWGTTHWGTDYGRDGGSGGHPIFAVKDGTVVRVGPASGFGQWIGVDHPASNGGGETIYGHIIPEVRLGQVVAEGQRIGRINPDSNTNGGVAPHLHLEWHRYTWVPPGPNRLNPETMLKGAKWPGEKPAPTPSNGVNLSNYFDVDWAPRFNFGGPRSTSGIQRVVVHTTENTAGTPAENVANYQINSQSGSYHVLVDTTGKRLRENTDDWITWSVGNNAGNVQGLNISFVAQAAWSRAAWLAQERMLRQGATVVAHWCKTYNIPVKKVTTERGICGHGDLRVFGGTDHTDPGGNFPWDVFIRYVNEAISGTNQGGFLMALSDAEQRELLAKTRDNHRELTQLYPSRSAYRKNDEPVDTLAGYILNIDGRIHENWVLTQAKESGMKVVDFVKKLWGGK